MNDLSQTLEVGSLLVIETGEYSDKNWLGPVRMLKRATKAELSDAFKADWKPEGAWGDSPSPDEFLPWLIKAGWAEDVPCDSWHVGSYGDFEP